jgi:cellulose synthase/poly-beta-1,6-N-acetylglucosamine synthase-like glycosyltransferase
MGFLDADHVLGQRSLDELVRLFGQETPPLAVQGRCETLNRRANPLVCLLSAERRWLERVELLAGPRLGGICQFGGGQGFFRAGFLKETESPIDETMILDDTDLSVRMALNGHRIRFSPYISTRSLQPETLSEFLDQRFRWARGWLQLARKHFLAPLRRGRMGLATRLDLVRLITTPFAGLALWLGFLAAAVGLTLESQPASQPLVWACLLWPLLLGLGPLLSGALPRRPADVPLVLLGIPLLTWFYAWVCAASVVDVFVLRRAPGYAKTVKRMRDGRGVSGG